MSRQDNSSTTSTLPLTSKGDIVAYSTESTRLAVGTNDYVLTADSSEAKGIKWAAAAAGGGGGLTAGSFAFANNVSSAANVTGLSFSGSRSGRAHISCFTDSTSGDKSTVSVITAVGDGINWAITEDNKVSNTSANITFSITSGGQVQYTSPNDAGFTSGVIKWNSDTTAI